MPVPMASKWMKPFPASPKNSREKIRLCPKDPCRWNLAVTHKITAPSCFGMALTSVNYPKDLSSWNKADIHKIPDLDYLNYEIMRKKLDFFLGIDGTPSNQMIAFENCSTRFNIIEPCVERCVQYEHIFCNLRRQFIAFREPKTLSSSGWREMVCFEPTMR